MRNILFTVALSCAFSALADSAGAADWPWWRGPTRDGKAPAGERPPVTWGEKQNVAWKTAVPGRGHASPIVVSDAVLTTTADEEKQELLLLCFDRATGKNRWSSVVHRGGLIHRHDKNSHASPTPAFNGRHVLTVFAVQNGLWVSAVDLTGKIAWQKKISEFNSQHGYGSSPLIYENLVIVSGDHMGPGALTALDAGTGEVVWRTARTEAPSYATPILAETAGRKQVVTTGQARVTSYDPATGKLLWSCDGTAAVTGNTVAWDDKHVYASGGFPVRDLLAVRTDGTGNVSGTHVTWRTKDRQAVPYVPSMLLHEGVLYAAGDGGVVTSFEAATGKVLTTLRLRAKFTSSPMLAAGHIYLADEDGVTHVLKAGPGLQKVAENKLDAGIYASPTFADHRLYIRSLTHLYCIADGRAAAR